MAEGDDVLVIAIKGTDGPKNENINAYAYEDQCYLPNRERAEQFYAVHKERPFFDGLCSFMTSGPVVVQVLEGDDAIARNREIMGATDPAQAAEGTIRKDFAQSIEANSVHGSDGPETAAEEIAFFFSDEEIVG